jgi:MFS family permease
MNSNHHDIQQRLDTLSWRPIHSRITVALGIGWLLDSFEVNIVGSVLGILQKLWNVSAVKASALVTVWLIGIMIGALFFGYLSDRFGRRKLFLMTLFLYSTFTVISAVSPGYGWFVVFRFLTAIGVGAEYSAINAAIAELIPARFRGSASAGVMNFWPLGAILAAAVSYYFISVLPPSVGWRFAFALGGIVALFTIWARRVLPESPRWLLRKGMTKEAEAVTQAIEGDAAAFSLGREASSNQGEEQTFFSQLRVLFRDYPARIALGSLLDFSEAAGYYGIFAFLPLVVLPHMNIAAKQVPLFFLWGNVGALLGGAASTVLLDRVGRKSTVTGFYALATLAVLAMGAATLGENSSTVLWSFIAVNFCATGSWVSAYPTFSEIFPTSVRSTGIGFSVAFGRIGAAIAPLLLTHVAQRISIQMAFYLLAGFWFFGVVTMVPWCIWGEEGRYKALEAIAEEGQA